MKKLFIILLLFPLLSFSQYNKEIKKVIITSSLVGISGAFDGTAEYLKFHYREPNQFWNPNLSWTNKWKNGDPLQGEKFWQSSRALVWTTDGYHLMRFSSNVFMMGALVINIGEKQKWYVYITEFFIYYIAYTTGFTISYELLKK